MILHPRIYINTGVNLSHRGSKVRKPCHANSKWRQPQEEAGVKFDKSDYVKDWEHAKNTL